MQSSHFSILNKTRGTLPRISFLEIKEAVLGKNYDLSVVLVTPALARSITLKAKHKDKASNVLSFPLSKNSGEIVLCPATARKEAPDWDASPTDFLTYLLIHGLLHLKGEQHGSTMEKKERSVCKRFGVRVNI